MANGLVADDGERQCWATIRSGLSAGLREQIDLDKVGALPGLGSDPAPALSLAGVPHLPPDTEPPAPLPRPVVVRVELSCLLCGEIAGLLENQRILRPRWQGSLRYDGRRLTCGRCGSVLIAGEEDRTPLTTVATDNQRAGRGGLID